MKPVLKALGVAIGIFLAVEIILFFVGVVILQQGSTLDPNGITSTPSVASQRLAVTVGNLGAIGGLVLATIGGIVYGVRSATRPPPARSSQC